MRYSKYGAKKTEYNGIKFDSKKEAERFQELLLLQKANKIKNLKLQPKYELQEKFILNGKTHRAITYIADFEYLDLEKNIIIVEDVKSSFTAKNEVFRLKEKMFLKKYGNKYIFRKVIR